MDSRDTQRDEQLAATPEAAFEAQIEGRLKQLHTMLPGIVQSFNPATQTASVQPAIKRIFTEQGAVNLPLCVDVPVEFPGGGDFFLTFPVKAGDECILVFSERCIDNWFQQGGTQEPAEYRLHDLSDAVALVGLNSQPKNIPSFNSTDVELRDRGRTVRVTMKPDGTIENVNSQGSTILSAAGKFTINAPQGFEVNAPLSQFNCNEVVNEGTTLSKKRITGQEGIAITGTGTLGAAAQFQGNVNVQSGTVAVTGGDATADGISLKTHRHGGVLSGGSNTGTPI